MFFKYHARMYQVPKIVIFFFLFHFHICGNHLLGNIFLRVVFQKPSHSILNEYYNTENCYKILERECSYQELWLSLS